MKRGPCILTLDTLDDGTEEVCMPLYRINISRTFRGASTLRCYLHIRIYKTLVKSQNNKRTRKKKAHQPSHIPAFFSPNLILSYPSRKTKHVKTTPVYSSMPAALGTIPKTAVHTAQDFPPHTPSYCCFSPYTSDLRWCPSSLCPASEKRKPEGSVSPKKTSIGPSCHSSKSTRRQRRELIP